MALHLLNPGIEPLGQFDMVDGYLAGTLGGEVGTLTAVARTNSTSEKAAADALDGYTNVSQQYRAALTRWIRTTTVRPLWLLDDGLKGYGTLFGVTIGTPAGLGTGFASGAYTGTPLGPHTAAASGKVTAWDKPGLYGVTLDACDTDATTGLQPTNATLTTGAALYPIKTSGFLTPTAASAVGGGTGTPVVARFVEFETTARSLVRTPPNLAGAAETFEHAVISYRVE
jgi:hypothetical protein